MSAARDGDVLASIGRRAPWLILAYVAALFAFRLWLSPFLEVDEAEYLGRVDLRLVYENSHPPLFNWLVRGALELTGWWWPGSVALVKYGFLGLFHLCIWDAARRLAGDRAALLAVAASAFLPQVVWMSAHTLSHSIMVLAAVAGTAAATVRAAERPGPGAFLLIGLALLLGAMAKYNFFLFAIPFAAALAASAPVRARLGRRDALIAPAVMLAGAAPFAAAALQDLAASGGRAAKLYAGGSFDWLDLPWVGVDGLASTVLAVSASAGVAAVAWAAARLLDRLRPSAPAPAAPRALDPALAAALRLALARAIGLGLALFALGVFVADVHRVHERYLTPIFATLPIVLAVTLPLRGAAPLLAGAAAATYLAVFPGVWYMVETSAHRYSRPYPALAAQIRAAHPAPSPIRSARHDDAANLTLALGWPGARSPTFLPLDGADRVLLLWRGGGGPPARLIPEGFRPAGPAGAAQAPLLNALGRRDPPRLEQIRHQMWVRSPE